MSLSFSKNMKSSESKLDEHLIYRKFIKLYYFATKFLDQEKAFRVHNIADPVGDRTKHCCLDMVHITEGGNAMVAARLHQVLKEGSFLKEGGSSQK